MRALIQRVKWAKVKTGQETVARIGHGLLLLLGFSGKDTATLPETPEWSRFLSKIVALRIFPDGKGKMNLSLADVQGEVLVVSQFTLYADCRKGNRPSFSRTAPPQEAEALFDRFVFDLQAMCTQRVEQGQFGAEMEVFLCNWGPVTIWLDSQEML